MPCWIYINGYPGVGKLAIGQEVQKLVPKSKVFHNHLMIDPAAAIVDRGSPEYHEIRTSIRQHILSIIASSQTTKDTTWIFTDSRSSDPIGRSAAQDFKLAAERRGVKFIPVNLNCSIEENLKRAASTTRSTTAKITDPEVIHKIRQEETMYRFGIKEELELDVTMLKAFEAAQRICHHVQTLSD